LRVVAGALWRSIVFLMDCPLPAIAISAACLTDAHLSGPDSDRFCGQALGNGPGLEEVFQGLFLKIEENPCH
jgi:hypothetical protein